MGTLLLIIGVPFALIFLLAYYQSKAREEDKKEKGYLQVFDYSLKHFKGVPDLGEGELIKLYLYSDRLTINDKQIIPLERIKQISVFTDKEVREQNKSVVGRAVVGGLLLGPVGALVGGISGVGNKKEEKTLNFLSIDFSSKQGQESNVLFLSDISTDYIRKAVYSQMGINVSEDEKNEPYEL